MATLSAPNLRSTKLHDQVSPTRHTVQRQLFDRAYIDRLTEGDPETSAHFVKYFTGLLVSKLHSKFRSSYQVEDVAQETLLRVFRYFREKKSLDHPERLGAFVYKFCDNVALELGRERNRFQQVPENAPEPLAQALSAETNCITAQRKAIIAQALTQLDKRDRVIIQKVFLLEQDKDMICRELGIDRNYLRVRVHRALAHFRSHLNAGTSD